jgi:polysaccharide biosynthesis transport protein
VYQLIGSRTAEAGVPHRRAEGPLAQVQYGWAVARRHYWLILASVGLSAVIGAAYIASIRAVYTASATMMIDSRRGGIQQKSVLGDSEPTDSAWIDSQIGVLSLERGKIGESIAAQFVPDSDPDLYRSENPGGILLSRLAGLFGPENPNDVHTSGSDTERAGQLSSIISNGLDVKRVGLSYLVNISFSSHSEGLGAKIVNAAADAYVVAEMKAKEQDLRQASDWLQQRYQTLRDQATAADRAVMEFKNKNNIVTSDGKLINDQQLTSVNNELAAARVKTGEQKAKLEEINRILAEQEATGEVESTVSEALVNPIVLHLRGQYLDIMNKLADWSKRFGPNHLAVVSLQSQAKDIRTSTHEELKRIAESDKSDYEIAKKEEESLEKQLASVVAQVPNEAQITLRSLEASAQSYRAFYDNFFLRYTESIQQQSSPIPETRVVSYAQAAYQSYPSYSRIMTLSIFGGIFFGFGVAFLREKLDRAFRTGVEVESLLGRECLAMVPELEHKASQASGRLAIESYNFDPAGERIIMDVPLAARTLFEAPFSPFTETIRALKMSADAHGRGAPSRVIGVTSSLPLEGKSTIATALAGLSGLVGAKTILVDCDLRKPALSQLFAPSANAGILEVISGEASLEDVIWAEPSAGFDFLPAINFLGHSNTAQLLAAEPMKRLFEELKKRYEYVIVDLSPVLPVVDVRATVEFIDFYFFIIEWGRTRFEVLRDAMNSSHEIYQNTLGFVLNKVDLKVIHRYYNYHAGYDRISYYGGSNEKRVEDSPIIDHVE